MAAMMSCWRVEEVGGTVGLEDKFYCSQGHFLWQARGGETLQRTGPTQARYCSLRLTKSRQ